MKFFVIRYSIVFGKGVLHAFAERQVANSFDIHVPLTGRAKMQCISSQFSAETDQIGDLAWLARYFGVELAEVARKDLPALCGIAAVVGFRAGATVLVDPAIRDVQREFELHAGDAARVRVPTVEENRITFCTHSHGDKDITEYHSVSLAFDTSTVTFELLGSWFKLIDRVIHR